MSTRATYSDYLRQLGDPASKGFYKRPTQLYMGPSLDAPPVPVQNITGVKVEAAAAASAEITPEGVSASFGVGLGGVLGDLAAELAALRKQRVRPAGWDEPVWPIQGNSCPSLAASATVDVPDLLGPHQGYAWDVTCISVATFTTGQVNMYKGGGVADVNLRSVWSVPGANYFDSRQMIMMPGQRMIFTANGSLSPFATISFDAIQIPLARLDCYLSNEGNRL
jgi:hypothetical protein